MNNSNGDIIKESNIIEKELRKIIENYLNYEIVEWAIRGNNFLENRIASQFLIDIAITNNYPIYRDMALTELQMLLVYEDSITKDYILALIEPIRIIIEQDNDENVRLTALRIYEKLTNDLKITVPETIQIIEESKNENAKRVAFWLLEGLSVSNEILKESFLKSKNESSKFWFAFLLYIKGDLDFQNTLLKMKEEKKLNEDHIDFWNKQAHRFGLQRISISKQKYESKIEEIGVRIDDLKTDIESKPTTSTDFTGIVTDLDNTVKDLIRELKKDPRLTAKQIHEFKGKEKFWDRHAGRIIAALIGGFFGMGGGALITWLAYFLSR